MNSNEIKNLEDALAIIQALQSENEKLKQQNANLTELIVKSQKKMFGKSSESIGNVEGAEQLTLFNEAEQEYSAAAPEPTKETLVASHTRKAKRTKEELTEKLEHREMVCDLEDKHCRECGEELVCIGSSAVS